MNKLIYISAIIAVIVVAAVILFLNRESLIPSSSSQQPSFVTQTADTSAATAGTDISTFVNDTTPTTDQVIPGLA